MKKTLYCLLTILLIFVSCAKKYDFSAKENASKTITGVILDGTKTYIDNHDVKWSTNDEIYLLKANVLNKQTTYVLTGGQGTTVGTFAYSSGEQLTGGDAVTAIAGKPYGNVAMLGKAYIDVPKDQSMEFYDANTVYDYTATQRYVPLISRNATVGQQFEFHHLASAIKFTITNSTGSDVKITKIQLQSDGRLSSRLEFNPSDNFSMSLYTISGPDGTIQSTGSYNLEANEQKCINFIAVAGNQNNFKLKLTTETSQTVGGEVVTSESVYQYEKSTFTTEVAKMHAFNVDLNSSHLKVYDYQVSYDGTNYKNFELGNSLKTDATTVILRPLNSHILTSDDLTLLNNSVSSITSSSVDVDLRQCQYESTTISRGICNDLADKLNNLYLPNNLVSISGYYRFAYGHNIKLHIPASMTYVDYLTLTGSHQYVNSGCGFFVETGNTTFDNTINDGILYSYDKATLLQRPMFETDNEIDQTTSKVKDVVIIEGVTTLYNYSLSNNERVNSYRLPKTLTTINSFAFYGCPNLNTVYFTSATVPNSVSGSLPANGGTIIIDTGDASTDQNVLNSYAQALSSFKNDWTIKTAAGVVYTPSTSTIAPLGTNSDYNSNLW